VSIKMSQVAFLGGLAFLFEIKNANLNNIERVMVQKDAVGVDITGE